MTREVNIGNVKVGGGNPIAVQSMLSIRSDDLQGNVRQAVSLRDAGCEIIRVAVPDFSSIRNISAIKEKIDIPVVADIHFDYNLALESAAAGVDKIRINPGNIGDEKKIHEVAKTCQEKKIPIRIGVNSGSVEKNILKKHGSPTAQALAESALYNASLLEKFDFKDIVISVKSSDVKKTIDAYKIISKKCNYPLHLGVTEAGTESIGTIKSAIALGSLLLEGIGDTIRVSLTAQPEKEVEAGFNILKALGMHKDGVTFISCPTCGRTKIDIISLTREAEKRFAGIKKNLKIAVMGCAVNGPGEAKEADYGIAGGDGFGVIFKKGKILKHAKEEKLLDELEELLKEC